MKKLDGTMLTVLVTEGGGNLFERSKCDRVCFIKRNEMPYFMLEHAAITAIKACEKFGSSNEDFCTIARVIKDEFNLKFGRSWHCLILIRGGSSLTHEQGKYICIEYDPFLITLFK